MIEQKEIRIEDLNDDNYLIRVIDSAPVDKLACVIEKGKPGAGYLSQELINKMIVMLEHSGHKLTVLYLSSEDTADIIEWESSYDRETEQSIFESINTANTTTYTRYCLPEGQVCGFSFVDGIADCICVGIIDKS